jgi:hypothetical protein
VRVVSSHLSSIVIHYRFRQRESTLDQVPRPTVTTGGPHPLTSTFLNHCTSILVAARVDFFCSTWRYRTLRKTTIISVRNRPLVASYAREREVIVHDVAGHLCRLQYQCRLRRILARYHNNKRDSRMMERRMLALMAYGPSLDQTQILTAPMLRTRRVWAIFQQ